eukprot:scaffold11763_cov71-Phaeocystis_antarctica.AAC.4
MGQAADAVETSRPGALEPSRTVARIVVFRSCRSCSGVTGCAARTSRDAAAGAELSTTFSDHMVSTLLCSTSSSTCPLLKVSQQLAATSSTPRQAHALFILSARAAAPAERVWARE